MHIQQIRPDCPPQPSPSRRSEQRLQRDVRRCAVPRDIHAELHNNAQVRVWLQRTLSSMGLQVSLRGSLDNVVALPPQLAKDAPLTLVCAHYDSVPRCPGADDNASAIAVMLEVARGWRTSSGAVGFVAFNAEERGLCGSREFVAEMVARQRLNVVGAHVLEMVGYTDKAPHSQRSPLPLPGLPTVGDFVALVANGRSRPMLAAAKAAAKRCEGAPPLLALQTMLGSERLVPDLLRSDHAPFWEHGIGAVMWTDTAEFRNPHYHRASDTPDTLDYTFMAGVTGLLKATLGMA